MSDDDPIIGESTHPNAGITLPVNTDASYNPNLSPFFFERSCRGNGPDVNRAALYRGLGGYLWASTKSSASKSYHINIQSSGRYITPNDAVDIIYP